MIETLAITATFINAILIYAFYKRQEYKRAIWHGIVTGWLIVFLLELLINS